MSSVVKNPEEIHISAILYPAPGKMQRLKEVMQEHINPTHKNEDYTPRYLMLERNQRHISRDGADMHTKTQNFKAVGEAIAKEGSFRKEPYWAYTKTVGGYDWDGKKLEPHL